MLNKFLLRVSFLHKRGDRNRSSFLLSAVGFLDNSCKADDQVELPFQTDNNIAVFHNTVRSVIAPSLAQPLFFSQA